MEGQPQTFFTEPIYFGNSDCQQKASMPFSNFQKSTNSLTIYPVVEPYPLEVYRVEVWE
jgi:hypothetical protein